jgi:hypothetical protein
VNEEDPSLHSIVEYDGTAYTVKPEKMWITCKMKLRWTLVGTTGVRFKEKDFFKTKLPTDQIIDIRRIDDLNVEATNICDTKTDIRYDLGIRTSTDETVSAAVWIDPIIKNEPTT